MIAFLRKLFPRKPKRLELRLVPYGDEADALINAGWRIAKEEDSNRIPFHVYLERTEP